MLMEEIIKEIDTCVEKKSIKEKMDEFYYSKI